MAGIKNLNKLLKEMKPKLVHKKFVFCTVSKAKFNKMKLNPLLVFKEKEGIAVIIERKTADANSLAYSDIWTLITLNVHSDLSAIGFLAKITNRLAEEGISTNVVSAYFHDHLFVPANRANEAIYILNKMSKI